ncbi:hypothetical protein N7520_007103 [Penicillium odoratum]|uniref:uncharacterized protein n=1 Tax=Penicillium odoratum TaxID=1167516 RepID=UPI002549BB41|nr:uncharacterized protein N7520_007103 [Penicillium odoratum]KAJ5759947.1 hypothetical protein N7520_007103 [Penicillium odoratum]
MSNQPPHAFGGHPNYSQWPPPYPSMLPPDFHTNPEHLAGAQVPPFNPNHPLDPNMAAFYANAQLSGPVSHGHPFYPPPFPFMNPFDPSQIPPQPFPPFPLPPLDYASMQAPAGSSNPKPVPTKVPTIHENVRPHPQPQPNPKAASIDRIREEGEVSEEESGRSSSTKDSKASSSATWKRKPSHHSEMEEGETTSSRSRSSSRSSTPYNPPLSVAADPEVLDRAIEMQKRETTTTSKESELSRAAKLRVQAQGALLSLVPHNIQYNELVAEGLNPEILRELYKQVGIKVVTEADKPVPNATSQVPVSIKQAESAAPKKVDNGRQKSSTALPTPSSATSSAPQSDSGKPMERKEVIARMLAAKAAKASEAVTKAVSREPSSVAVTPTPSATPSEGLVTTVVPMREKNKAQTELARQRIEELKRQALLKSQQKAQLNQPSNAPQVDRPAEDSSSATQTVQHPLPVRPPAPQTSEFATIPGLSMTGLKTDSNSKNPTDAPRGFAVDSTPVSRAGQRKRPRASDFDEPDAAYKKPTVYGKSHSGPADRLIIEFSDDDEDESLYGDDTGAMDVDSNHEPEAQPAMVIDNSRPALQKYPSSTSTPQGFPWQSDSESMRQKDLEIQEMHRKIALLTAQAKAKKAKLAANRTESPRTIDGSTASSPSAEILSPVGGSTAATSSLPASTAKAAPGQAGAQHIAQTEGKCSSNRPPIAFSYQIPNNTFAVSSSPQAPASVSMQENDSGDESSTIPQAISTVPLVTEQPVNSHINPHNDYSASPSSPTQSDSSSSAMDESEDISSSRESSASEEEPATFGEQPILGLVATAQPEGTNPIVNGFTDSLSTEEGPSERESPAEPPVLDVPATSLSSGDHADFAPSHTISEGSSLDMTQSIVTVEDPGNQETLVEQSLRESSCASEESDAYEPPEADTTSEPNSPYSPPFSPAPHAPLDDPENSMAMLDDLPADKPLTDTPQVPVTAPHPDSQVETLGNRTSSASATSQSKFTPYVSPLRSFKAYRYHPAYAENVSDGYRSLTYSHEINEDTCLCPYELAGGVCNDRSCQFQHFRDMTLSDDKILIEMGSVREGQTEEEKETYLAGLKEIINEMRRDKVKDFSTVASEIAAYRRRFLQDPSRVLSL